MFMFAFVFLVSSSIVVVFTEKITHSMEPVELLGVGVNVNKMSPDAIFLRSANIQFNLSAVTTISSESTTTPHEPTTTIPSEPTTATAPEPTTIPGPTTTAPSKATPSTTAEPLLKFVGTPEALAVHIASRFHYNAFKSPWMTPHTPFFLSDHFITHDASPANFFGGDGDISLTYFGPALTPKPIVFSETGCNMSTVLENDVVFCRSDLFQTFVTMCLPSLQKGIILITGRWFLPALEKDALTETVLADHRILKWFSQNPMYPDGAGGGKFSGFPYGVISSSDTILKILRQPTLKTNTLFWSYHEVRPNQHGARTDVFTNIITPHDLGLRTDPDEFFKEMYRSRYVLSLRGDRPDCHRHWESIIFGAIPICNCHPAIPSSVEKENNHTKYTPHDTWFGKNLISLTTNVAVEVLNKYIANSSLPEEFDTFSASPDFVSFEVWCRLVREGKNDKTSRCGSYAISPPPTTTTPSKPIG